MPLGAYTLTSPLYSSGFRLPQNLRQIWISGPLGIVYDPGSLPERIERDVMELLIATRSPQLGVTGEFGLDLRNAGEVSAHCVGICGEAVVRNPSNLSRVLLQDKAPVSRDKERNLVRSVV
jgi:hypothetical protein